MLQSLLPDKMLVLQLSPSLLVKINAAFFPQPTNLELPNATSITSSPEPIKVQLDPLSVDLVKYSSETPINVLLPYATPVKESVRPHVPLSHVAIHYCLNRD